MKKSLLLAFLLIPLNVIADEGGDVLFLGLELEKLLNIGSGILAIILCVLSLLAYHRNNNQRLLFVGVAFLLFAMKSFLVGAEIWFGDWSWVDPVASVLDFAILLSFFVGIIRK